MKIIFIDQMTIGNVVILVYKWDKDKYLLGGLRKIRKNSGWHKERLKGLISKVQAGLRCKFNKSFYLAPR